MQEIEALLICNSNMFVPTVLTEVLTNDDKEYLVISDTANITLFFEFLRLPNVTYYEYGIKRWKDLIHEKKKLYGFLAQYKIKRLVFFHAEFGEMANWLISKMSRQITVQYCKLYESIPAKKAPFSFSKLKIQLKQYIYWGQKMDVMYFTDPFPSIPKSFYKRNVAEFINIPVNSDVINSYLKAKLDTLGIKGKCVLLTGTGVKNGWYTEKEYTKFINRLIETIGVQNVISKCHPRYHDLYGMETDLPQIPSFLPGNVLIENFDFFIGLESTLLVEAAQAGKTAISYVDLLPPDERRRKIQHDFFNNRLQGRGVIYYPTSMEDIKKFCLSK